MEDLEIVLGLECNNNCIFCSNQSLRSKHTGMSLESVHQILKENPAKGDNTLFFVGGEPTIRKDIFKIIGLAKECGYKNITFLTNGRMCKNKSFVKKLVDAKVNIAFSIHGHNALIHDKLTRTPGSFEQALEGMNNFKQLGIKFQTNTVITRQNCKYISEIVSFLSLFNPYLMLFSLVSPVGIPKENLKQILPDLDNLKLVVDKASQMNQHIRFHDVPLCIMGKHKNLMHENDIKIDRKVIVKGFKEFNYLMNKNNEEKVKLPDCSGCIGECNGLWKGYLSVTKPTVYPLKGNIIEKFNYHKKSFKLQDNPVLNSFRELVMNSNKMNRLECSVKVEGDVLNACRFNLTFKQIDDNSVNMATKFFAKVQESNIDFIMGKFGDYIKKAHCFIVGIDLRERDSRVKLWFHHGNDNLIGWDFFPDGRIQKKEYFQDITHKSGEWDKMLKDPFLKKLAKHSKKVQYRPPDILYFKLMHPKNFVKELDNPTLDKLYTQWADAGYMPTHLGLKIKEVSPLINFNLYY